jgi:hypothetical protein
MLKLDHDGGLYPANFPFALYISARNPGHRAGVSSTSPAQLPVGRDAGTTVSQGARLPLQESVARWTARIGGFADATCRVAYQGHEACLA